MDFQFFSNATAKALATQAQNPKPAPESVTTKKNHGVAKRSNAAPGGGNTGKVENRIVVKESHNATGHHSTAHKARKRSAKGAHEEDSTPQSESEEDSHASDIDELDDDPANENESGTETNEGEEDEQEEEGEEEDEEKEAEEDEDGHSTQRRESFDTLRLAPWLQQQCKTMGMPRPTEIQALCVPHILRGENCIGAAKTGSGKTAAFALPILHKLSEDPYGVYAIVLTPTRELAFQISEQFTALGQPINLRVSVVVGGLDMMAQALEISKRPHVVIATPGRLADHINSSPNISFSRVRVLVLDEADRVLSDTFREHLETILEALPRNRQTLLFSATMHVKQEDLDRVGCVGEPFRCEVKSKEATVTKLDQRYIFIPTQVKDCYLFHLLQDYADRGSLIIFTSTCRGCESLSLMLRELGFDNTALHSKMPQNERLSSLAKFRSSLVKILVATDVASRGLDIPTVQTVVNYDVPATTDDYIHRVGRTARAGRGGIAMTMITQYDVERIHKIEDRINKKLEALETDEDEVLKSLSKTTKARRAAIITMGERDFGERDRVNAEKRRLLEGAAGAGSKKHKKRQRKEA